jgi:hypothetical protein
MRGVKCALHAEGCSTHCLARESLGSHGGQLVPGTTGLYDFWQRSGPLAGQFVIQVTRAAGEM